MVKHNFLYILDRRNLEINTNFFKIVFLKIHLILKFYNTIIENILLFMPFFQLYEVMGI